MIARAFSALMRFSVKNRRLGNEIIHKAGAGAYNQRAEESVNIVIHDRDGAEKFLIGGAGETMVIADNGKIKPCVCCFGCWVKTPGRCVIKDGFENMGELWSKCGRLIIISRCVYGGFSPFVKNVLDRSVCPYQLPYFTQKNGETRHINRYKNKIEMSVCFYGEITEDEKETAILLGKKFLLMKSSSMRFYDAFENIKEALK
ncbi:MAG: hypothetical protein LBU82_00090 [Treponema sp.]|jgi:multimeric flavodoxin WrbA|nr:hypothetical protein [Treponema sp.]